LISSPCVKVCVIDAASGLCSGCGRSLDEIARWGGLMEEQRRHIMAGLPQRMRDKGLAPNQGQTS
jgi:uncharacterized protein